MNNNSVNDVSFDDAATSAMGEAFDQTCKSFRIIGCTATVREIIAMRIIDAATNGERDPARLCEQALMILGIEDVSILVDSVGRAPPTQPTL
jgi:hypothetical protein